MQSFFHVHISNPSRVKQNYYTMHLLKISNAVQNCAVGVVVTEETIFFLVLQSRWIYPLLTLFMIYHHYLQLFTILIRLQWANKSKQPTLVRRVQTTS